MEQEARAKVLRKTAAKGTVLTALLCALLLWTSVAGAEPGRGRPDRSAEPKRSYGAIDVILYQTSW